MSMGLAIGMLMLILAVFHIVAMILLWPIRKSLFDNYFSSGIMPPLPPKPETRRPNGHER